MLLNADVGEGLATDVELFPFLDQANISCGEHAGNNDLISETLMLAKAHDVSVGAHPSYPDRDHFGRRQLWSQQMIDASSLQQSLDEQLRRFCKIAEAHSTDVDYIKPHGALYNELAQDIELARVFAEVCSESCNRYRITKEVMLIAGLDSSIQQVFTDHGFELILEAFADRRYLADGSLQARSIEGSVFSTAQEVVAQARGLSRRLVVKTFESANVRIKAHTLCLHGDNPASVTAAARVRSVLGQ